ncbi:hypothetical protein G9444_6800 (plasmid) [Rhodococcus erythropolis]|jgi:hypothetical protein|uniref:Conjugal transfer protein TrbC n=1 Tax=Rhodococcus erythropolis TaxID=1833 RepID=A0A6G9D435_RHOER|nr:MULTISPECIES: hypothetical protein [Rhodococcus]MDV8128479.1 hypothetical protein [Rhodococcus sp. IEGM 1304]QIP44043.1 hypothetical protein G9444_6800 [Rhodococcus erythropolis]
MMIYLAQHTVDVLAQIDVPDPPPKPLPGKLGDRGNDLIGYAKTGFMILAMLGFLACAGLAVIGIKGRSEVAKAALGHLPWALFAVVLGGGAAGLIQAFQ